jgi:hypothetical protein
MIVQLTSISNINKEESQTPTEASSEFNGEAASINDWKN